MIANHRSCLEQAMRHDAIRVLTALTLCLVGMTATAQNMVVKGATILDITNGNMIKNHVVIVKDGRIDAVSPARSANIPKGI